MKTNDTRRSESILLTKQHEHDHGVWVSLNGVYNERMNLLRGEGLAYDHPTCHCTLVH